MTLVGMLVMMVMQLAFISLAAFFVGLCGYAGYRLAKAILG